MLYTRKDRLFTIGLGGVALQVVWHLGDNTIVVTDSTPHWCKSAVRGRLKRNARAGQLFGRLAVLETHALRY